MTAPVLSFTAEDVGTDTTMYTSDFVVYMIAFQRGDPEKDGHCWQFSREFADDWGVCTVREVQAATVYEGITSFRLSRTGLACVFDPSVAPKTGVSELRIAFEVADQVWDELVGMARIVFRDRPYFQCHE